MKYLIIFFSLFIFLSCGDSNNGNDNTNKNETKNYSVTIKPDLSGILPDTITKFALTKTPSWLRAKFLDKLDSLKPLEEDKYPGNHPSPPENVTNPKDYFSNLILEIQDNEILDEVIYQIVITPNNELTSFNFRINLFIENAKSIYQIASELKYVDIFEGENYTTLKYKIDDGTGKIIDYELPYYYYYNYVLPLVIDDNSSFYVTANSGEFHEKGVTSHEGKMWRDYIYNHKKDNRPSLKELLANKEVLWRHKSNFWGHYDTDKWTNGYKDADFNLDNQVEKVDAFLQEAYSDQGALGSVIEWMMKNMIFGAQGKRPIEPAEIFTWGWGNCGEWGDLTTASMRTALIPTTIVSTSIDDHVWNEFFDGEWHNVEPYHPFVDYQYYDKDVASELPDINGFGWQAHMTTRARPDGLMEDVIDRYSGYGTLNLTVKDKNGNPLDDSIILIYGQGDLREEGQLSLGLVTYTDIFGNASIKLGDNRAFWGVVFTPLGNFPIEENKVESIIDNVETDNNYTWDIVIDAEKSLFITPKVKNNIDSKNNELQLSFNLKDLSSYSRAYNIWKGDNFLIKNKTLVNNLSIMILDEENYQKFKNNENPETETKEEIKALYYFSDTSQAEVNLPITKDKLYFVIANKNNLKTSFWTNLELSFNTKNQELKNYNSEVYIKPSKSFIMEFSTEETN